MIIPVAITVVAIAANALIAVATFARARFVTDNLGDVDLPPSRIPVFAALQAAGAAGLLVGLVGFPTVGVAAGVGLVLFFVVAVGVHLRAHAYKSLPSPLLFLVLAVAALVCAVIR